MKPRSQTRKAAAAQAEVERLTAVLATARRAMAEADTYIANDMPRAARRTLRHFLDGVTNDRSPSP